MHLLELILSPIVWLMGFIFEFYIYLFFSTGTSILLLSSTFALLLFPLQKKTQLLEQRIGEKIKTVDAAVTPLKNELKGEKLFLETEKIYKKHAYHPIHSIGMGASFFIMTPVLISAILLFTSNEILNEKSFLFVQDLSEPDRVLGIVNILPLLMFAITLFDAKFRFKDDEKSQYRFYFISFVLLVIVYNLPSGLVLYWIGSNIMSLTMNRIQSRVRINQ